MDESRHWMQKPRPPYRQERGQKDPEGFEQARKNIYRSAARFPHYWESKRRDDIPRPLLNPISLYLPSFQEGDRVLQPLLPRRAQLVPSTLPVIFTHILQEQHPQTSLYYGGSEHRVHCDPPSAAISCLLSTLTCGAAGLRACLDVTSPSHPAHAAERRGPQSPARGRAAADTDGAGQT